MFSGIVEEVGRIEDVTELDGGRRLRISCGFPGDDLADGASISVDGACLTVVSSEVSGQPSSERPAPHGGGGSAPGDGPRHSSFEVDAVGTTLSRTVAGRYRRGTAVNLERSRALGERMEGHLVQGHVDGIGTVHDLRSEGMHRLLDIRLPPDVWRGTLLHGSIAVNGVSLTVNRLDEPDLCQVAIIPFTWNHTNLAVLSVGDAVNVEGDLIGKYVGKYLSSLTSQLGTERPAAVLGSVADVPPSPRTEERGTGTKGEG